jgi:hypothetical protein
MARLNRELIPPGPHWAYAAVSAAPPPPPPPVQHCHAPSAPVWAVAAFETAKPLIPLLRLPLLTQSPIPQLILGRQRPAAAL